MTDELSKIRFFAANYSRLQGLRALPVGMLAVFVSIWALYNQGPAADLTAPILAAISAALLYWLAVRYYNRAFGQVKQTTSQRKREWIGSIAFGVLGLLAFVLDTTQLLAVSMLGLVFAVSFFEYFLRADRSEWKKILVYFPENIIGAILIAMISLLPLLGITWWKAIGIGSQVVAVFMVVGVVIIVTGIWSHIRITRALSTGEAKSDDIAL